ncbi:efflux RND transporter periplasmic adaptor subunit [Devosia sp. WQ 349]|uniref:efflux RND transporter periplasmic adaptor subunit n=1 Tax=Devosia sp. WQ 349K1 TaxID=2800329 RepID=UPI00190382F5|nr:efflux RND transporter periplasmic adaptor subunit [Devosia sp. WQ 349K1]MBK1795629.1 efflux RND transporter periplasmic adaptor subunit [Devosia sp. WQ 349K1]
MKSVTLLTASALALCLSIPSWADDAAPGDIVTVRPVLTQLVTEQHASAPQFVGVVSPRVSASIAFRVGGTLVTRQVDLGAQVSEGTPLANLDATTQNLAVQTARADLASAKAQYANAAAAEGRLRTLTQTDVVSIANLELAEQQTSGAKAMLVQAESRLRQTQEQLSYTTLLAPFDGIVTAVNTEAGSVVAAGQSIITLADPTTRDLVLDLPDSLMGEVSVGTEFQIWPQLTPETSVPGTVREIAPQADPITRAWRIKIGIETEVEAFWLGSTASAALVASSKQQLTIPASAVKFDDDKTGVWIVDEANATVHYREVVLRGAPASGRAIVSVGLQAGERVVVAGVNSLTDGQSVKLILESKK